MSDSDNLLSEFIFDARDHLGTAGAQLLDLEKNPGSLDSLNALMGTMHTLKGNSGFMELQNLYHLMHNAESLLQTIREKQTDCPQPVIDLLLQVMDTVEAILNNLSGGGQDTVDWLEALTQALSETESRLEEGKILGQTVSVRESVYDDSGGYGQDMEAGGPDSATGPELEVTPEGVALVILGNGDLGRAGGEHFPTKVEVMFKAGGLGLVVDLKGLTDLAGREVKLLLAAGLKKPGRTAFLVDPEEQPDLSRLFQILDPDRRLNIFADHVPALTSFGLSA